MRRSPSTAYNAGKRGKGDDSAIRPPQRPSKSETKHHSSAKRKGKKGRRGGILCLSGGRGRSGGELEEGGK